MALQVHSIPFNMSNESPKSYYKHNLPRFLCSQLPSSPREDFLYIYLHVNIIVIPPLILILVPYRDIDISAVNSEDCEEKNCIRCSDMDMRIAARLVILIALIMVVTMVSEGSTSRPLKLKFIFEGDQVENNNNIEMKNGLFESLPKGSVPPTGPSQCKNYRSSGGGSCPV
jgi:hypothetical protein